MSASYNFDSLRERRSDGHLLFVRAWHIGCKGRTCDVSRSSRCLAVRVPGSWVCPHMSTIARAYSKKLHFSVNGVTRLTSAKSALAQPWWAARGVQSEGLEAEARDPKSVQNLKCSSKPEPDLRTTQWSPAQPPVVLSGSQWSPAQSPGTGGIRHGRELVVHS